MDCVAFLDKIGCRVVREFLDDMEEQVSLIFGLDEGKDASFEKKMQEYVSVHSEEIRDNMKCKIKECSRFEHCSCCVDRKVCSTIHDVL